MDQVDLPSNPRLKVKARVVQKQSDDFGRKRWEVEHFEELEQDHDDPTVDSRSEKYLLARTQKLDLEKRHKKDGFYCQVCNQLYKCDIAYLTHINSQFHNSKLGMSLKVEASSLSDVKNKLLKLGSGKPQSKLKQKLNEKKMRIESIIKRQLQDAIKLYSPEQEEQSQEIVEQQEQQEQSEPEQSPSQQNQEIIKQDQSKQAKEQVQDEVKDEVKEQVAPEQDEQDPNEAMMRAMGLPTSFKSKKR